MRTGTRYGSPNSIDVSMQLGVEERRLRNGARFAPAFLTAWPGGETTPGRPPGSRRGDLGRRGVGGTPDAGVEAARGGGLAARDEGVVRAGLPAPEGGEVRAAAPDRQRRKWNCGPPRCRKTKRSPRSARSGTCQGRPNSA